MLYGRYQHNVDAKGRLFVPAKLREKLGESFIAAVVLDRCICLYSTDEWDAMLDQIAALPMTKGRVLMRQLTSNAEDVTPDAQGRILIRREDGTLAPYAVGDIEHLRPANGSYGDFRPAH